MNSLSWFLYLAEVVPNIGVASIFYLCIVGFVGSFLLAFMAEELGPENLPIKTHIALLVGAVLLAVLTPSKQTIYLIAGSEAGEYVVTSPEGQEIINDIKAIIKSQIEELK